MGESYGKKPTLLELGLHERNVFFLLIACPD